MFRLIKFLVVIGVIAAFAACARQDDDFLVVDPEPISSEPVYTGKYK